MRFVRLAGACTSGACPTVYSTDEDDVAVQGVIVPVPPIDGGLPQGEAVVRIPRSLLIEAARELR